MKYLFKKPVPWEHQDQAFEFAYDKEAVGLFMDMGTGKTKVAINLIVNRAHNLTLIVCPKSVVPVWPNEFKKHCPIPVKIVPLMQSAEENVEMLRQIDFSLPTIVVVNYEGITPRKDRFKRVQNPLGTVLLNVAKVGDLDCVICDESHKIKAAGSSISNFMHRLGQYVPYRICLTGTPLADKKLDAYGQYRFLDHTIFGTNFNKFKNQYCDTNPNCTEQVIGFKNESEFNEKFFSIAFIVEADEVQDLPEVEHVNRYCYLGEKGKKIYQEFEEEFITFLDENLIDIDELDEFAEIPAMIAKNVLVEMLRLHQVSNGVATYEVGDKVITKEIDTAKRDLLVEVLGDIPFSEPVVCFYRFKHDLLNIKYAMNKAGRLCAEQNGDERQWEQFQNGNQYDAIAVNIKSGGAGIDLTRARHQIFYNVGLSLADYQQSLKRGHRPGQDRKVLYHHLVVKDTIDEDVRAKLEQKGSVVNGVLKAYGRRKATLRRS